MKLRTGYRDEKPTMVEVARAAEGAGADAVFLHARSRTQRYRRPADWSQELNGVLLVGIDGAEKWSPTTANYAWLDRTLAKRLSATSRQVLLFTRAKVLFNQKKYTASEKVFQQLGAARIRSAAGGTTPE